MNTPTTLLEAVTFFADPERAWAFAVKRRWPNGVACPRMGCGSASVTFISTRKKWRCKECRRQFSVKVNSIFEESPIPFTKWLPAIWLLANTKNGTSSHELARALGITQKTAWYMLHRIRLAMKVTDAPKFFGEVEADETFIGGRQKATAYNSFGRAMMKHGPSEGKTTVMGIVQRGAKGKSRARAWVVPDRGWKSLVPKLFENVTPGSKLYTGAWRPYHQADRVFMHEYVDHSIRYVMGRVHTNTMENFWSCLKRTVKGTYIAPRPFHLDAYLDEQVFRFNAREDDDAGRFSAVLKTTDSRRMTYKALINTHPRWRLRPGRVTKSPIHPVLAPGDVR